MNISICITVFNEEGTIAPLLDSLVNQSKKADEIVVVDGGSKDKTVDIIRHFQKKYRSIKLLVEKVPRAKGRNMSIEIASNDTIAITDAGCVTDKNWLKNITRPFETGRVDIVAGFYHMVGSTNFQKAESVFLGVTPKNFDINFLPSTRSMAFRKSAWEAVGRFPEGKGNSAEDTDFNFKAVKLGLKYSRVKNAIVEWGMPKTLGEFKYKMSEYAKWDIRYGIWWHPTQRLMSHNIKVLLVFLRYILGLTLLVLGLIYHPLLAYPIILFLFYLLWSYRKIYLEFGDHQVALWGTVLQVVADISVMQGFVYGMASRRS